MFARLSPVLVLLAVHSSARLAHASEQAQARVIAVRSSASQQGNPATHAVDNSATTRWSAEGDGHWIALEIDRPVELSAVEIGFHHGSRRYRFDVETSKSGETFVRAGSFESSGSSDAVQSFSFPKVRAQHVRIVGHGSNANRWNNIHTLRLPGIEVESPKPIAPSEPVPPAQFVTTEFAPTGLIGSAVGITLDDRGRVYVSNTTRRNNGALDIRRHTDWLLDSLASRSVEDKRAMIRERKSDWKKLFEFEETIYRLEDTDGDGRADERKVFFRGLNSEVHGLAGGVLFHQGAAYVTCIPGFYKLPDADEDGVADGIEELVHGFGIHVGYGGHDMHGPTLGPDGRIYWSIGDKGIGVRGKEGRDHIYPGHGGVMRIEPDGSGFEVFAHGLRNPQELAFDEHGNLFTVDNDGDFGDRERVHFVVEGTDSGWRAHYQYRTDRRWRGLTGYNPWIADGLWKTHHDGQPAYLTPSLANFSTGPIGLEYNPGTALGERYRSHFFLAESNKQMQAFRVEPSGAGFRMMSPHVILKGPFVIGIRFGPDGALYLADWGNNPWAPHDRGRVLKLDVPEPERDPLRKDTREILARGVKALTVERLVTLLAHADQRVRLRAQLELVRRGDEGRSHLLRVAERSESELARLHAIWGIGQLARKRAEEAAPLVPLLADAALEVRAQAAKVIGEAGLRPAAKEVGKLLADPSPRVRLFAGIALRTIGSLGEFDQVVKLLEENDGRDPLIRHAGVFALRGICATNVSPVVALSRHASPAVRRAAVVVLRRLRSVEITRFLDDTDSRVVGEAARAIHDDLSIAEGLEALAALTDRGAELDEATARRALSACLRVGDRKSALRLVRYAATGANPEALRALAMSTLGAWTTPPRLDSVQGFHRRLAPRPAADAHQALDTGIGALLASSSSAVQSATAKAIQALQYGNATERVTSLSFDDSRGASVRVAALEAMHALDATRTPEAISVALDSRQPSLREAALRLLARRRPNAEESVAAATRALESDDLDERQSAVRVLGLLESPRAAEALGKLVRGLLDRSIDARIRLEVYETARSHRSQRFQVAAQAFEQSLKAQESNLAELAVAGGNAQRGSDLFRSSSTAQCQRCHELDGKNGNVGPSLAGVATKRDRAYLLRALVNPAADVDEAFRVRLFILRNGTTVSGSVVESRPEALSIARSAGEVVTISRSDIANEVPQAGSVMPDLTQTLGLSNVRDLVEYLSTLK